MTSTSTQDDLRDVEYSPEREANREACAAARGEDWRRDDEDDLPMSTKPTDQLELVSADTAIPHEADSLTLWDQFRAQAEKLKATADTLTVTEAGDKAGMALARATRLTLKELRVSIENKRKELKEDALRRGQKIDAAAKELKEMIEPLETRLLEQEQFAIREAARIEQENRDVRTAEITPFLIPGTITPDFGKMTPDQWGIALQDAKDAHAARVERARKEEEDCLAAIEAERKRQQELAEEAEKQRIENERLKAEAEKQRKEAEAERLRIEAERQAEREAQAAELKKQQEAAEKKRLAELAKLRAEQEERERAEAEKRAAAEEIARKERDRIELERRAKEAEANEAARQERLKEQARREVERQKEAVEQARLKDAKDRADKLAATEREERLRLEREADDRRKEGERQKKAVEAAAKKAAAAPDVQKLRHLAGTIMALPIGQYANLTIIPTLVALRKEFAGRVEVMAKELEQLTTP